MSTLVQFAPAPDIIPAISAAPRTAAPRRSRPWARILGGTAALVLAAAGLGGYLHYAAGFESTDDSFLEGNIHPVSPRINGTVTRVLVDDNDHVEAGQPLVELDPADLNLAVQGAEADLAQARANADQVGAQISRAQAEVEAATARLAQNTALLTRASLDFQRMEILASDQVGVISHQEFDVVRATRDAARAAGQSLQAEQASAEAALTAARAQRAVAAAQIQKAGAMLAAARLQADYAVIRAPSAGRVAKKSVETGQRLQPGQPVLSVVSDQVWVVANFKEGQLARLRPGAPVEVRIDAVEGRVFHGTVDSFSPGTGARFSLLPPDNATGNFTKVVQRVPVKILLTPASLGADASRLAPGLSAAVKVGVRG
jgi:membrane fusion protein (multidrug efflux system)